jgi:hydrogenase expression/formation protein HypD
VVAGFEPLDILLGVERLVEQIETGTPSVESAYMRGVKPQGNKAALKLMYRVFEPGPASWRGVGIVPESGLLIRDEYRRFDAAKVFNVAVPETKENPACLCGEVLRGVKLPTECSLFGVGCTPEHPVGPCMVSSEGSCSACYLYGDADGG